MVRYEESTVIISHIATVCSAEGSLIQDKENRYCAL